MTPLVTAVETRFGFQPPAAYRFLTKDHSQIEWPLLPEFHWLNAEEIARFTFSENQWPDFVPFGRNSHGDLWCWCPAHSSGGKVPVGLCPENCEEGEIYAPDFAAALFRLVCDAVQFLSAQPAHVDTARRLLLSSAHFGAREWPAEWADRLCEMSAAPLSRWLNRGEPVTGLLPPNEYDQILSDWLDDGETGSVFRWMTPP